MNTGETIALIKAFGNGGGGSSLPSVTSYDNGKVLAVKDGAWAADSNLFIVTKVSGNTADKTLDEVKAAVAAGMTVMLKYTNSRDVAIYAGEYYGVLYFVTAQSDATYNYMFSMSGGNSLTQVKWPKLPMPSASDNGSELIVKNGAWAKQQKKFVVTLTPTSSDYSGTMDKTVAEITAAYEAGQEIIFHVVTSASSYVEVPVSFRGRDTSFDYPNFGAEIIESVANLMIVAQTGDTSDGTKATYSTHIYSLTPAS